MLPSPAAVDALRAGLAADLGAFTPELAVAGGVVLLLLARLTPALDRVQLWPVAVLSVGGALVALFNPPDHVPATLFSGLLAADSFAVYAKAVALAAALLAVLLTALTGLPDRDDSGDFYVLLLGGTLGMMLMTAANHLLMVFLAVEMASLPGYALAGFLKGRRTGGEAALKYVVFGAAASGVMLYGISLLAGISGTGSLPAVAAEVAGRLRTGGFDPVLVAGLLFLGVGLAFKLAAVPAHFWCPDVFEGAAAEVAGFLSVASKAAAVALAARLLASLHDPLPGTVGVVVGVVAAVTVTFGNLAAFGQTNLKRLLAYSTIAHAGYMLLALSTLRSEGVAAVLFYLAGYVALNMGAFAAVAFIRNRTGSEELDACRGLMGRSPLLAGAFAVFLLGLLGLPPLAGFAGKFQVFAAVWDASRAAAAGGNANLGTFYAVLLAVGAVNTVASAYYYLNVVRVMVLEVPSPEVSSPKSEAGPSGDLGLEDLRLETGPSAYLAGLVAVVLALGVVWNPLTAAADRAATGLVTTPPTSR